MRPLHSFMVILGAAISAMVLMVLIGGPKSSETDLQAETVSQVPAGQVETVAVPVTSSTNIISSTPLLALTASLPGEDGPALVRRYCTGCHLPQLLEDTKQSRAGWETTLTQMETLGVQLNGEDRAILLDYLAGSQEQ